MAFCISCKKQFQDGFDICPHCGQYNEIQAVDSFYLQNGTLLYQKRYQIQYVVNSGGFGIVYAAKDVMFDKIVAIKEYYPGGVAARMPGQNIVMIYSEKRLKEFNQGKDRFLNEARHIAKFNDDPGVVDVYDFFEENNTAYMVMEYMEGMTYKEFIRSATGGIPIETATKVAISVLDALATIHKENIIHRDINPNNIYICNDGRVKLFDFGSSRIQETEMSAIITPAYAPPEQYSTNGKQGFYTDIYAVGATTYYALTGLKPEESTDRVINDELVAPHVVRPDIPAFLSNAIMRAMAINPKIRFQSSNEFKEILHNKKQVLDDKKELKRRKTQRLLLASSFIIMLLIAGGYFSYNIQETIDESTLQATTLDVWLMADDNDTIESAQERFLHMTEDFAVDYPQVKLNITVYPQDEYTYELNQSANAGTLPDLFESTALEQQYIEQLSSLDLMWNLMIEPDSTSKPEDYLFLQNYETLFPQMKQVPLCFQVPLIYENIRRSSSGDSSQSTQGPDNITELEDLSIKTESHSYLIDSDSTTLYKEIFSKETINTNYVSDNGLTSFINGNVEYYLSDTTDYQHLTQAMPAGFRVLIPDVSEIDVYFDHYYSVSSLPSSNEGKAAQWLLYYLLSEKSQAELTLEQLEGIPLNKTIFDVFLGIYTNELGTLSTYQDRLIPIDNTQDS